MKKILTIILSLAMIMSLFCAVPVQARVIQGGNYYIEDFEQDHANNLIDANDTVIGDATSDVQISKKREEGAGYGGSGYALKVDIRAASNSKNIGGTSTRLALDNEVGKLAAGERLVVTMKYKSLSDLGGSAISYSAYTTEAPALHLYIPGYYSDSKQNWYCIPIAKTGSDEWKTVTFEFDYRTDAKTITNMHLSFGQYGGNMSVSQNGGIATFYFDDIEIRKEKNPAADDAVTPAVSNLTASMDSTGHITSSYTYTENGAAVDTHESFWRVVTAEGGVVTCESSYLSGAHIPEAYREQNLYYEVVPVSSNGDIGEVVRVPLAKPAVVPATIVASGNGVTVSAGSKDITNAKVVFVTYDINNKMVDFEAVDVPSILSGANETFEPVDLEAGTKTKAMLWQDMINCVPLADVLEY